MASLAVFACISQAGVRLDYELAAIKRKAGNKLQGVVLGSELSEETIQVQQVSHRRAWQTMLIQTGCLGTGVSNANPSDA